MITVTDCNCLEVEADKRLAETERPNKALVLHPARHMCDDMSVLMCLFVQFCHLLKNI